MGWHFLYEGLWKYQEKDGRPFTAEGYFQASAGPLSKYFRGLIPDGNGALIMQRDEQGLPQALKARWQEDLDRFASKYQFDADEKSKATEALAAVSEQADGWFRNPENAWKVRSYLSDLRTAILTERDPESTEYQLERAWKQRMKLNGDRKEILGVFQGWTDELHNKWLAMADAEEVMAASEPRSILGLLRYDFRTPSPSTAATPMTQLDWMNTATIYGLIIAGACLILGLLTPLAALWCAGFLALIYLSMPPWPGLPDNPLVEGHYWIVSKNLIEMLVCLALVFIPTGKWIGLDALLFGWRDRRRTVQPPVDEPEFDSERTSTVAVATRPATTTRRETR